MNYQHNIDNYLKVIFPRHEDILLPTHTQVQIIHYLVYGLQPSGFLISVLMHNHKHAEIIADVVNIRHLEKIYEFCDKHMPDKCTNTLENISNWCKDVDNIRSDFVSEMDKKIVWMKLND